MTSRQPERTAARRSRSTVYGRRRRGASGWSIPSARASAFISADTDPSGFVPNTNVDPLIAEGYAGKTGSDAAAEGCLAFFARGTVGGRGLTAVGVVIGKGPGSGTSVILAAAGGAATQLSSPWPPAIRVRTIAAPGRGRPGRRRWQTRALRCCSLPVAPRRRPDVNALTIHRRTHE